MTEIMAQSLEMLLAKDAIRDLLYTYCHACDRGDNALMKSVYHPTATDNHGIFNGNAHDFVDYALERMEGIYAVTQHHITNIRMEFHGDACAYVESYFLCFNRWQDDFNRDSTSSGRYIDRFEKRDGSWRIAARQLIMDWTADQRDLLPTPATAHFLMGSKHGDDFRSVRLPEHVPPGL